MLDYIRERIVYHSPVVGAVYVVGDWYQKGFIYLPRDQNNIDDCKKKGECIGHAVIFTGFNNSLELLEFKNSWGQGWGTDGYGYMSYEYFLKMVKNYLISY